MLITVNLPKEMILRIDSLVESYDVPRPVEPLWPFLEPNVVVSRLEPEERERLRKYQADYDVFKKEHSLWALSPRVTRNAIANGLLEAARENGGFKLGKVDFLASSKVISLELENLLLRSVDELVTKARKNGKASDGKALNDIPENWLSKEGKAQREEFFRCQSMMNRSGVIALALDASLNNKDCVQKATEKFVKHVPESNASPPKRQPEPETRKQALTQAKLR